MGNSKTINIAQNLDNSNDQKTDSNNNSLNLEAQNLGNINNYLNSQNLESEISDNNYTLSDIEIKNWRWQDSEKLYINNKPIGK